MDLKVGQLVLDILTKVDPSVATNIQKVEKDVKNLGDQADKTKKKNDTMLDSFGKKLAGFFGITAIIGAIYKFGEASVKAFTDAQQSLVQFNNAQQNVAGTTKEQINSLNDYIKVLETKTAIDDKIIRQSSQIYAQDQISIENQKKLLQGTLDLAVANARIGNTSEIDARGTAVAIGRFVATGDTGILTKQNIVGIDEATQKMAKLGDENTRVAIAMKLMKENAQGASEQFGNSFAGSVARAKDFVEDLQISVGQGLSVAFLTLTDSLSTTQTQLGVTQTGSEKMGSAMVFLSGILGAVINTFKVLVLGIIGFGKILVGNVGVVIGFAKDVTGAFAQVGKSVSSIGTAFKEVLSGNFEEAKNALKDGFDFSGVFNNSKEALDNLLTSVGTTGQAITDTTDDFVKNGEAILNSTEIFKKYKTANDELVKAKDSQLEASKKVRQATEEEKQATEEAKQKTEQFTQKLIDVRENAVKTAQELKDNLSDAFKKFSASITDNVKETQEKLAEIVVNAEEKRKTLTEQIAKGGDVEQAQKDLIEVQKILDARVGYEQRSAERIAEIKSQLSKAGLDPNALNLDSIQKGTSLEQEIQKQKELASLDEFSRFEKQQTDKLLRLTQDFITETLLIKQKIDKQKEFETDLTSFLSSEQIKRQKDIENFANSAILKYGQMASSLRDLISLQSQLANVTAVPTSLPQFHAGGFVGSAGGEVHAGEFVIPQNLVASMPDLVSMLDRARSQTNNITINSNNAGSADFGSITQELLWRLGRL